MKNVLKQYINLTTVDLQQISGGQALVRPHTSDAIKSLWKSITSHLHIG